MNSYIGYISLVLLVVLNKTASFENVHGGIFYNYKLVEGNVLLSLNNRGPRLCLRDCLMRTGCNAIYFDSVHLTCHLLKEAIVCYDKWDKKHIFTEKRSWSMVRKVNIYISNSQNLCGIRIGQKRPLVVRMAPNTEIEPRTWCGVHDATLCDQVCQ